MSKIFIFIVCITGTLYGMKPYSTIDGYPIRMRSIDSVELSEESKEKLRLLKETYENQLREKQEEERKIDHECIYKIRIDRRGGFMEMEIKGRTGFKGFPDW